LILIFSSSQWKIFKKYGADDKSSWAGSVSATGNNSKSAAYGGDVVCKRAAACGRRFDKLKVD
jgi:hypothetical protein